MITNNNTLIVYTIIVTFNSQKWVKKCLDSLLNSTLGTNVLIVDNNSKDATLNILEAEYPNVIVLKNKENLGFAKANNQGIKIAIERGAEYVFLLNHDAWVENDTIEKLVGIAIENPDYGIISPIHLTSTGKALDYNFCNYMYLCEWPNIVSDLLIPEKSLKPIYNVEFVNAAAWLVSTHCILLIGGFNTIFQMYGEDNEFVNRATFHGFKIGVCPTSYIYHDREKRAIINSKKMYNRRYASIKVELLNIRASFRKTILTVSRSILIESISNSVKLDIKHGFNLFLLLFRMIKDIPILLKNRKKVKTIGQHFIS